MALTEQPGSSGSVARSWEFRQPRLFTKPLHYRSNQDDPAVTMQIKAWESFDQSPNCVRPTIKGYKCGLFVTNVTGKADANGLMTTGYFRKDRIIYAHEIEFQLKGYTRESVVCLKQSSMVQGRIYFNFLHNVPSNGLAERVHNYIDYICLAQRNAIHPRGRFAHLRPSVALREQRHRVTAVEGHRHRHSTATNCPDDPKGLLPPSGT